jgi:hypothetical protein
MTPLDRALQRLGACVDARKQFKGMSIKKALMVASASQFRWVLSKTGFLVCLCRRNGPVNRNCPYNMDLTSTFYRRHYGARIERALCKVGREKKRKV